jgi:hypothetical protein
MAFPPTVSRFCCCCSLKAGAYIIGSIGIVYGALLVLIGALFNYIISQLDKNDKFHDEIRDKICKQIDCDGFDVDDYFDVVIYVAMGIFIVSGLFQILTGETPGP